MRSPPAAGKMRAGFKSERASLRNPRGGEDGNRVGDDGGGAEARGKATGVRGNEAYRPEPVISRPEPAPGPEIAPWSVAAGPRTIGAAESDAEGRVAVVGDTHARRAPAIRGRGPCPLGGGHGHGKKGEEQEGSDAFHEATCRASRPGAQVEITRRVGMGRSGLVACGNLSRCARLERRFSSTGENGQEWIRTTEGKSQQIYSLPRLATPEPARKILLRPDPQDAPRGSRTMRLMLIFSSGKLLGSVRFRLISSRCSRPSRTRPKTVYLPLRSDIGLMLT